MIKYQMHCISKYVVDWCVLYGIDTLIVGHNNNWKQENKGMQNFTYVPYKERRVYRGLFVSNDGKKINADVNGAYQIMKKVIPDAFSKGIEGAGLHPTIINLACSR